MECFVVNKGRSYCTAPYALIFKERDWHFRGEGDHEHHLQIPNTKSATSSLCERVMEGHSVLQAAPWLKQHETESHSGSRGKRIGALHMHLSEHPRAHLGEQHGHPLWLGQSSKRQEKAAVIRITPIAEAYGACFSSLSNICCRAP